MLQIVKIPPENPDEENAKFDVAAYNAEVARIAHVGRTWLAGLVEARTAARKFLPTLSEAEKQMVYDADKLAMRLITEGIRSMLDSKPLCEEKPAESAGSAVI